MGRVGDAPRRLAEAGRALRALGFAVIGLVVLAAALAGTQLVALERRADMMHRVLLPDVVAQQKRAIWTESLRSAADLVVFPPEPATREEALVKARQLASNLVRGADADKRRAIRDGLAAIETAAAASREAERGDREIKLLLAEADDVIQDMGANLASIVEDSAGTLARMLNEFLQADRPNRPNRHDLEDVLALNTTSQDLLASLDRGRILLTAARAADSAADLQDAAAEFAVAGAHLRARVESLRGNSDYEYLPRMIERFVALAPVFERRLAALRARAAALEASGEAKRRLALLRENLAADAAAAAEAGVAEVAGATRRLVATAAAGLAMVGALGGAIVVQGRRLARQSGRAGGAGGDPGASDPQAERRRAALVQAAGRLRQAGRNLQYWRDHLPRRLHDAARSALACAPDGGDPAGEERGWPDPQGLPRDRSGERSGGPPRAQLAPLPEPLADQIRRICDAVWLVAEQVHDAADAALLDCLRGDGAPAAEDGAPVAEPALAAATAAASASPEETDAPGVEGVAVLAEDVVARIAAALSEINGLAAAAAAGRPSLAHREAVERVAAALEGLGTALELGRERPAPHRSAPEQARAA